MHECDADRDNRHKPPPTRRRPGTGSQNEYETENGLHDKRIKECQQTRGRGGSPGDTVRDGTSR